MLAHWAGDEPVSEARSFSVSPREADQFPSLRYAYSSAVYGIMREDLTAEEYDEVLRILRETVGPQICEGALSGVLPQGVQKNTPQADAGVGPGVLPKEQARLSSETPIGKAALARGNDSGAGREMRLLRGN